MASVALVGPELEENLGLRYIAAALERAGHPSTILPLDGTGDLGAVRDAILAQQPAIVGLSLAFQWRAMDFFALAVALRDAGYAGKIVGGGHFSAFTWREILTEFPEIDLLCRYEAEQTMVDLAGVIDAGGDWRTVGGLGGRADDGSPLETPLADGPAIDALAWPDRRGAPIVCLGHPVAAMVASRGCYARCAFCCIAAWHGRESEGVRFRVRAVSDVADEMAFLHHEQQVGIFIFHDDDFFVPGGRGGVIQRLTDLADALDARGVREFVSVVKARPNDVKPEVFRLMRERLGLNRVFLGVETDAVKGLATLDRRVSSAQNHAAMQVCEDLGLYTCFNLLMFDPDTTIDSLLPNLAFMERYAHVPFNFGRAELYAGTPLLARMQAEGRARGDWLGWDYALNDPSIQAVFDIAMKLFYARNFAHDALANRLQGTRFDVEVAASLHADRFRPEWRAEAQDCNRTLGLDSAAGLRRIIGFVQEHGPETDPRAFIAAEAPRLREVEQVINRRASDLEHTVRDAVGAYCRHSRPRAPLSTLALGASP